MNRSRRPIARPAALPPSAARPRAGETLRADTFWVSDTADNKLYAYTTSGARVPASDIALAAAHVDPVGLWGDGETLWVGDLTEGKAYANSLSTRMQDSGDLRSHARKGASDDPISFLHWRQSGFFGAVGRGRCSVRVRAIGGGVGGDGSAARATASPGRSSVSTPPTPTPGASGPTARRFGSETRKTRSSTPTT